MDSCGVSAEGFLRRVRVGPRLLITLVTVTVVPLLVTTLITSNIASTSSERAIMTQAQGTIGQAADAISSSLAELERRAVRVSYSEQFQELFESNEGVVSDEGREAAGGAIADEFRLTTYLVSLMVSVDGIDWTSIYGTDESIESLVVAQHPDSPTEIARQGGRSIYTATRRDDPDAASLGAQNFMTLWRPVYNSERTEEIGFLAATVQESYISSLVRQVNEIPGSRAFIVTSGDREIVSNVGHGLFRVGRTLPDGVPIEYPSDLNMVAELEGSEYQVATATVTNTDLIAVLLLPTDYIYSSRAEAMKAYVGIAAAFAVLGLILAAVVARTVNRPIRRLMQKIVALEQSPDLELTPDTANDEIAKLDQSFNQLMTQNRQHARQKESDLREKHRMQLAVLQAQVNPHFITNALNSVRQLSSLGNYDAVSRLTQALSSEVSRTFRVTDGWSTLQAEYDSVEDYALIASFRHLGRIALECELPHELADVDIPQFLLQPLVENSFVHGFSEHQGSGRVRVRSSQRRDGRIQIEITDNGRGFDSPESAHAAIGSNESFTRFGVRSVRDRLSLVYGDEASLEINSEPWIFTTITLIIPRGGREAYGSSMESVDR